MKKLSDEQLALLYDLLFEASDSLDRALKLLPEGRESFTKKQKELRELRLLVGNEQDRRK